jgi:hypothetical protein
MRRTTIMGDGPTVQRSSSEGQAARYELWRTEWKRGHFTCKFDLRSFSRCSLVPIMRRIGGPWRPKTNPSGGCFTTP